MHVLANISSGEHRHKYISVQDHTSNISNITNNRCQVYKHFHTHEGEVYGKYVWLIVLIQSTRGRYIVNLIIGFGLI
jgi:hypothetical protein